MGGDEAVHGFGQGIGKAPARGEQGTDREIGAAEQRAGEKLVFFEAFFDVKKQKTVLENKKHEH